MSDTLIIAVITGLVAPISTLLLNYALKKREDKLKLNSEEVLKNLKELGSSQQNFNDGLRAILRYRLIKDMSISLSRKYTTLKELQEICNLYENYIRLGGNSVVCSLYEDFMKLEIKGEA